MTEMFIDNHYVNKVVQTLIYMIYNNKSMISYNNIYRL